ncbi:GNAT family N-acetyltransferase [Paenibacillus auburnensis]|nr:GNAT family N-acetyltransferase [Paenibacillus auburnensis]
MLTKSEEKAMIELESKDYYLALAVLDQVKINTLFARSVLEQNIGGKVFADCADSPRAFYVVHSYGMSLLFGHRGDEVFERSLFDYLTNKAETRRTAEWLQADPAGDWTSLIDSIRTMHNGMLDNGAEISETNNPRAIQLNTRVNFRFDRQAYLTAREQYFKQDELIVQTTKEQFDALAEGVVPRFFWRDAAHFESEGIGYTLLRDGEIAATAFSACCAQNQLEIGIETAHKYRGKGYALSVSSALIDYCLERGLEPVWACRLENEGSYNLAQKLGFVPVLNLPYYRLAY